MAKFKRDQKIIIFSHSLALTIFQPRGPVGLAEGAGLTSSIDAAGSVGNAVVWSNETSV